MWYTIFRYYHNLLMKLRGGEKMTAKTLSDEIITYASDCGFTITNLKLQKTLYYIQGYHSKFIGEPLFSDDFEHWPYGPVIPSVYFEFCSFGANAIRVFPSYPVFSDYSTKEKKIIRKVLDKCLTMTARELVEKSHQEEPWQNTSESEIIPFNSILHYFQKSDPLKIGKL